MTVLIFALLALTVIIPFGSFIKGTKSSKRFKRTLAVNIASFFAVLLFGTVLLFTGSAEAAETAAGAASNSAGFAYLAAGLSTGLSCIGAGMAISAGSSAAIGAISEDESLMGKALIFVALGEGVAIYGLVISILILGRV